MPYCYPVMPISLLWGIPGALRSQQLSISASRHLSFSASQLLSSSLLREPGRSFLGPQSALYRKKSQLRLFFRQLARASAPQQLFSCLFGVQKRGGRWTHIVVDLWKEHLNGFWGAISSFLCQKDGFQPKSYLFIFKEPFSVFDFGVFFRRLQLVPEDLRKHPVSQVFSQAIWDRTFKRWSNFYKWME